MILLPEKTQNRHGSYTEDYKLIDDRLTGIISEHVFQNTENAYENQPGMNFKKIIPILHIL